MPNRRSTHESGMAGEFFVMEALYRLGHQPALTLGNAKSVDILVRTASGRKIEVSVKAVRGGGKWGVGRQSLAGCQDLIFVLLHYTNFGDVTKRPHVFVVPAPDVERLKEEWLDSYAVYFSNQEGRDRLTPFRDAWHWFGANSASE